MNKVDNYEEHWKEMPEFHQENTMPFQSVKLHFRNAEDRDKFAKATRQTITDKTKSVWFPKYDREKPSNFSYKNPNNE